jgi:transposase-like protein
MKERIQRDAHLKEINSLMVKESHAPLCQRDKSKLKNLKQKILKLEKGLSVRELSQITGITKSSIQRLMDNVREKIYQGLSPFILSGKEFQDMTQ